MLSRAVVGVALILLMTILKISVINLVFIAMTIVLVTTNSKLQYSSQVTYPRSPDTWRVHVSTGPSTLECMV